ncbi:MAG: beta-lactamase family protein [Chitinispirillales bacterium]|jgi:CubicO group peptidase (beta-lactamase class C family)|nr:beta-lactamase family protein [Chitinispirillales bacterium]
MPDEDKIAAYLRLAIERGVFPGCALGWVVGGEERVVALGRHAYGGGAPDVTTGSLFDCASVTKAIPVSNLALLMVDRGRLGLDDRLVDFVPEYRGDFRGEIRVRHLLTHTLDFDFRLSGCKELPPKELLGAILSVRMKRAPGEAFCYANATSILLGLVAERVGGKRLHELAREELFGPLGMGGATFFVDGGALGRCVPTEIDPWRGRAVCGEVHDESAWTLQKIMTPGSAGLFLTIVDIMKYVRMLVGGGVIGAAGDGVSGSNCINSGINGDGCRAAGTRLFSEEIIASMHTNQIPHISGACTGLGWELNQEYMGSKRTPLTFGKTGFTGCAVIIDRSRNAGLALLSNYTWPARKPNRDLINEVRSAVSDLVM